MMEIGGNESGIYNLYLRLAHLAGTGSERKRPGLVAVVVVVLAALAQAATTQKVANARVTFIWKRREKHLLKNV